MFESLLKFIGDEEKQPSGNLLDIMNGVEQSLLIQALSRVTWSGVRKISLKEIRQSHVFISVANYTRGCNHDVYVKTKP